MRILSLDPSVNNLGWALLRTKIPEKRKAWKFGMIKPEGMNYQMKLTDIIQKIDSQIGKFDILISEWPAFFQNERGNIAAHQNYTIDLAGIAMYVAGWYHMDHRHHFPLTPSTWKGSVPKFITERKFFRVFGKDSIRVNEHMVDAAMLLHYWLSRYGARFLQLNGETLNPSLL